jgi:purine-binding chemotaxis protein CheW
MSRALEMRAAFDSTFAQAPNTDQQPLQDFLGIRVGTDSYAIRLADISGLFADRSITQIPSTDTGFLGIAGLRGAVVPVYDLGTFLGYPPAPTCRWLVLIGGSALALAFEAFEGHLRLPQTALAAHTKQPRSALFVQQSLHVAGLVRPIVQVSAIFQTIEQDTQRRVRHEES